MTRNLERPTAGQRASTAGGGTQRRKHPVASGAGLILDYMEHARRKARRDNGAADPMVAEIVEALLFLGGKAHRDQVAARVLSERPAARARDPEIVRLHLHAAFEQQLAQDAAVGGRPALFDLPFGAGSHRWALAREAEAFLRRGRESRERVR